MLSREIRVSSNLEKSSRFLETVNFCKAFRRNFKRKLCSSLFNHIISVRSCFCACICSIFCFTYLAYCCFLCNAVFKFSFRLREHLLLLALYPWHLPQISHVLFALRLLCFIFQNWLDSSVSDLPFLWLSDFL